MKRTFNLGYIRVILGLFGTLLGFPKIVYSKCFFIQLVPSTRTPLSVIKY